MGWTTYEIVFRLRSPLHSGWRMVGNLKTTRPYVTGRMFWGALTMRLTRNAAGNQPAVESQKYLEIGDQVHRTLAFTYFYPALKNGNEYRVLWPWENENLFRFRFLSSYQSTALSYPQQSATEGMLHEVEFIAPNTLDTGEAVFLKGYLFEKEECNLDWRSALERLQFGGERGYGWGDVELLFAKESDDNNLFNGTVSFKGDGDKPIILLHPKGRLLAHTLPNNLEASGEIEPLVGREWRSYNPHRRYVGQHIAYTGVYFIPGSIIHRSTNFIISNFGIWQKIDFQA